MSEIPEAEEMRHAKSKEITAELLRVDFKLQFQDVGSPTLV